MYWLIVLFLINYSNACYYFEIEDFNLKQFEQCENVSVLFAEYFDNNYFEPFQNIFVYKLKYDNASHPIKLNNNWNVTFIYFLETRYDILCDQFKLLEQLNYLPIPPNYIMKTDKNLEFEHIKYLEKQNNITIASIMFGDKMFVESNYVDFYDIVDNLVYFNPIYFNLNRDGLMFKDFFKYLN